MDFKKLRRIARQKKTDPESLVISALNKHQRWESAGKELGVSGRTVERFSDANLDFQCVWFRKGEIPLIATMLDDEFSTSFSIEAIAGDGIRQPGEKEDQ